MSPSRVRTTATMLTVVLMASSATMLGNADAVAADHSGPWVLSTTDPSSNYTPAFIGNGYLGARVPVDGTGFNPDPLLTQSQLAGFYTDPPGETHWSEIRGSLPMWTTLGLAADADRYGNLPVCEFNRACIAAAGQMSGGAEVSDNSDNASGSLGKIFVDGFGYGRPNVGASVTVPLSHSIAGPAYVSIRYANAEPVDRTVTVSVDGGQQRQVTLPSTGSWTTWKTATIPATVRNGTSSVRVAVEQPDSGQVNLDTIAAYPVSGAEPTIVSQLQAGTRSNYRQQLDMKTGTLATSFRWTAPSGRVTDFAYAVNVDQSSAHVGTTTMSFTPRWSGPATVVDAFDGRSINNATASPGTVDGTRGTLTQDVTASGTGITASMASRLSVDGSPVRTTVVAGTTAAQGAALSVTSGVTYTATKFVGVAAANDGGPGAGPRSPRAAALREATRASRIGAAGVKDRNDQAWAKLWSGDISVPHDDALTGKIRASMFYLLVSTRADQPWSMAPGGLSSDSYNGHVFWDAETWLAPALLPQHQELASGIATYRQKMLEQAEQNTTTCAPAGQVTKGARYPWESALSGKDTYTGPGTYCDEIHITAGVALQQWNYYLATGDKAWLRYQAWPVLRGIADYWASRAVADKNNPAVYHVLDAMGPDEDHDHVNDSAYTNNAARTALRIGAQAAAIVGAAADPAWSKVADGLVIPFDDANRRHLEYADYPTGEVVKQADVTMMQYPWGAAMPAAVAQNDLDYYNAHTNFNGPSMSDPISGIGSAAIVSARCDTYTYVQRSVNPFLNGPFNQYREAKNGGAFTYITSAGGFLQQFQYGFTGLRWDVDSLKLDPSLPPQLPGLKLTGLKWHGATFDLDIGPVSTRLTVTDGPALAVSIAGAPVKKATAGNPLIVRTRTPESSPNLAQCKKVSSSAEDAVFPVVAAVDGNPTTAWHAAQAGAGLTIDLGQNPGFAKVAVRADGPSRGYTVQASNDNGSWVTLGAHAASSDVETSVTFERVAYRYLRLLGAPGDRLEVSEVNVS